MTAELELAVHLCPRRPGGGHRGRRDAHQQGLLAQVHPQPPVHRRHRREKPSLQGPGEAIPGKLSYFHMMASNYFF